MFYSKAFSCAHEVFLYSTVIPSLGNRGLVALLFYFFLYVMDFVGLFGAQLVVFFRSIGTASVFLLSSVVVSVLICMFTVICILL